MFILEEDYYFITIKILSILKMLDCDKKPFEDYRKIGIIFEFIKNEDNMFFFQKLVNQKANDVFDNERAIKIFCDSRVGISVIKRVLFILEKREMVELFRSQKNSNIDVKLKKTKEFNELIKMGILDTDLEKCKKVKELVPRIRRLKLETLQEKIFGYNEVTKWED